MGNRENQNDRRRAPRVPKSTFIAISTTGIHANDQAFGLITDVSARGLCVRTPQPPQVADAVLLRVAVEEVVHTLRARAVRILPCGGEAFSVGLEFDPADDAVRRFLAAHLGEKLRGLQASWSIENG